MGTEVRATSHFGDGYGLEIAQGQTGALHHTLTCPCRAQKTHHDCVRKRWLIGGADCKHRGAKRQDKHDAQSLRGVSRSRAACSETFFGGWRSGTSR